MGRDAGGNKGRCNSNLTKQPIDIYNHPSEFVGNGWLFFAFGLTIISLAYVFHTGKFDINTLMMMIWMGH
jgi:hypothetical protein